MVEAEEKKPAADGYVLCPACKGVPHPDRICYCAGDGTVPLWAAEKFINKQAKDDKNVNG